MKKLKVAFLSALFVLLIASAIPAKSIGVSPFKLLKVGSKNVTKKTKHLWMDTVSFKKWDGVIEIYMGKVKLKKGSRLKYKLKKGYKAKFYIHYTDKKGKQYTKKIKNNSKLPNCGSSFWIDCFLKKGKYNAPLSFFPFEEEG
jgi:hypothetical protein